MNRISVSNFEASLSEDQNYQSHVQHSSCKQIRVWRRFHLPWFHGPTRQNEISSSSSYRSAPSDTCHLPLDAFSRVPVARWFSNNIRLFTFVPACLTNIFPVEICGYFTIFTQKERSAFSKYRCPLLWRFFDVTDPANSFQLFVHNRGRRRDYSRRFVFQRGTERPFWRHDVKGNSPWKYGKRGSFLRFGCTYEWILHLSLFSYSIS